MGLSLPNPLDDGRQSQAALAIARGASRLLLTHRMACIPELSLANGRRADLAAVSDRNDIWIVEIKSCIADFRADQKWPDYRAYCVRLFFAVASDFPQELLPGDTGLIIADRYGGEIVRPAPEHRLGPAVRKAMTLTLARTAALRLLGVSDPELRLEEAHTR
jgi:hypothetical protein